MPWDTYGTTLHDHMDVSDCIKVLLPIASMTQTSKNFTLRLWKLASSFIGGVKNGLTTIQREVVKECGNAIPAASSLRSVSRGMF